MTRYKKIKKSLRVAFESSDECLLGGVSGDLVAIKPLDWLLRAVIFEPVAVTEIRARVFVALTCIPIEGGLGLFAPEIASISVDGSDKCEGLVSFAKESLAIARRSHITTMNRRLYLSEVRKKGEYCTYLEECLYCNLLLNDEVGVSNCIVRLGTAFDVEQDDEVLQRVTKIQSLLAENERGREAAISQLKEWRRQYLESHCLSDAAGSCTLGDGS